MTAPWIVFGSRAGRMAREYVFGVATPTTTFILLLHAVSLGGSDNLGMVSFKLLSAGCEEGDIGQYR